MIKREILEAAIAADAANADKYDKLRKTALLLLDYIDVISAELDETVPIADLHGWKSSRVEEGRRIREALGIHEPGGLCESIRPGHGNKCALLAGHSENHANFVYSWPREVVEACGDPAHPGCGEGAKGRRCQLAKGHGGNHRNTWEDGTTQSVWVQGGRPELRSNQIGERGNCSECGALVERLYSLRCPACYDKLASGQGGVKW